MTNNYQTRIRDLSPEKQSYLAHQLSTELGSTVSKSPAAQQLVAYITSKDGQTLSSNDLRDFLKKKLPAYMLPSTFNFPEELPRLPNGKVNRRELHMLDEAASQEEVATPPCSPVEEVLSGIWSQILNRNSIGMHDNFFEIGGHSLLVIQMISRIRSTLNVDIPLISVFDSPTITKLTLVILQDENTREKTETTASLLLEIASLPEDEVNNLLKEKELSTNAEE